MNATDPNLVGPLIAASSPGQVARAGESPYFVVLTVRLEGLNLLVLGRTYSDKIQIDAPAAGTTSLHTEGPR